MQIAPLVDVRLRQLLVGGEVEVGEDELTLPHVRPFALDRLLHLHDHLAVAPHRRGIGRDLRADRGVASSREAAAQPAPVSTSTECPAPISDLGAGGHERDAILVGLDLFRNADFHGGDVSMSDVILRERSEREDLPYRASDPSDASGAR